MSTQYDLGIRKVQPRIHYVGSGQGNCSTCTPSTAQKSSAEEQEYSVCQHFEWMLGHFLLPLFTNRNRRQHRNGLFLVLLSPTASTSDAIVLLQL